MSRWTNKKIETIKNYPSALKIFKIDASKFYYVRYYINGGHIRKSTGKTLKSDAIEFAKEFYEELTYKSRNKLPLTDKKLFTHIAIECVERMKVDSAINNPDSRNYKESLLKLNKDVIPFFNNTPINAVTYETVSDFFLHLSERNLSSSTKKHYKVLLNKIFDYAEQKNYIDLKPKMPPVSVKDNPRGWFNEQEYDLLKKTTRNVIKEDIVIRGNRITKEMSFLITFTVNSFLRPSDIKLLKHKHINKIKEKSSEVLEIQTEKSKTVNTQIYSMNVAVKIYDDILKFHKENENPRSKEDYVFFPKIKNRDSALDVMSRQFSYILKESQLKFDKFNKPRTLYSLRHTCIMFRILKGNVDYHLLAKNCRTSISMIERFYGSHLSARLKINELTGFTE